MTNFIKTPQPPYYAVIFTSQRMPEDHGYTAMAKKMVALALAQPGCFGEESARDADGFGITVSYFANEAAILAWKQNVEHLQAQRLGQERWYEEYQLRVAKVERDYGWHKEPLVGGETLVKL